MVVEHIFITTMEPAQAITAAGALLSRHQFVAAGRQGFAISDDVPATAEFVRKKKSQFMRLSNSNFLKRAQKVRLDFDRGRVTVAVAMDDHNTSTEVGNRSLFGGGRRKKYRLLEQDYLAGIASALEAAIARRDDVVTAEQSILRPAAEITALAKRQSRIAIIILLVIFLLVFGSIVIAVASSHR